MAATGTEALINIKFVNVQATDIPKLLTEIGQIVGVKWVKLAFGPQADAVAYAVAKNVNGIGAIALSILSLAGVAGTSTQILADA